jgi:hypothetical protein
MSCSTCKYTKSYISLLEETNRSLQAKVAALQAKVTILRREAPALTPAPAPAPATAKQYRIMTIDTNQYWNGNWLEMLLAPDRYDLVRVIPYLDNKRSSSDEEDVRQLKPQCYTKHYPDLVFKEKLYLSVSVICRDSGSWRTGVSEERRYMTMLEVCRKSAPECTYRHPELRFAGSDDEIITHLLCTKTTLEAEPRVVLIYSKRCAFQTLKGEDAERGIATWHHATAENDPITAILADPSRNKAVADLIRSMPAEILVQSREYDYDIPCLDVRLKDHRYCEPQ